MEKLSFLILCVFFLLGAGSGWVLCRIAYQEAIRQTQEKEKRLVELLADSYQLREDIRRYVHAQPYIDQCIAIGQPIMTTAWRPPDDWQSRFDSIEGNQP